MTRNEALADLASRNVITTARLADAGVLTDEDLRDAKHERKMAVAHVLAERDAVGASALTRSRVTSLYVTGMTRFLGTEDDEFPVLD